MIRRRNRVLALAATALATVACLAAAPAAQAHDSLAPPTAGHNWLPKEDWSAFHWSPFDERLLAKLLGISRFELYMYQADDHQSLADLAISRGVDPAVLREQLLAPWKRVFATKRQLRVLRNHTSRMLSQPHLAQHMFWHPFHEPAVNRDPDHSARHLFNVTVKRYRALRKQGKTQLEIAAIGGRSEAQLRRAVMHHMHLSIMRGVNRWEASRAQAKRLLERQHALLDCWMHKPLPHLDPEIPFGGDVNGGHGIHGRDDKIGVVTPKPAAGCWLPMVPSD